MEILYLLAGLSAMASLIASIIAYNRLHHPDRTMSQRVAIGKTLEKSMVIFFCSLIALAFLAFLDLT